ncbi:MAG: DNA-binding domain-containing protein [Candidatus Thiodiazotropha sp. (ex Lucinoma aequizonata)]|nr:DNA-binding domain-containing protein [Candidatus Thiodiazotropha sp. (ex Lucinoma aequizonata)]
MLQEHAILETNAEQAVWRAKVTDGSAEWAHELTLLRISRNRIWQNPEAAPEPFSGTIRISTDSKSPQVAKKGEVIKRCANPVTITSLPSFTVTHSESINEEIIPIPSTPEGEDSQIEEEVHLGTPSVPIEQPDHLKKTSPGEQEDTWKQFLNWLQTGLASGDIITNDVRARVHIVPEDVLIVSPAVFKNFALHSDHDSKHIQKHFQKQGLHKKTMQGTNIYNYRTTGGRKSSIINGLLIQDSSILFPNQQPPSNPQLTKK